jgi:S-adenosylmethionine synthetase
LDADQHVEVYNLIRPGSQELQDLFARARRSKMPLANDTSVGLGYAPMSLLERLVLAAEKHINDRDRSRIHPAWGEDIKILGIRKGATVELTVACAMIGAHLSGIDDYLDEKRAIESVVRELAIQHGVPQCLVRVNTADEPRAGAIYLTVTGTSAEAGDDGQVGRGNRVNGLITPYRPMMLEAVAGKNPVTHVGKIYNVIAHRIADTLVAEEPDISSAQCFLVSRIGAPVTEPALVHVKLATRDDVPRARFEKRVGEVVGAQLGRTPELIDSFLTDGIDVF